MASTATALPSANGRESTPADQDMAQFEDVESAIRRPLLGQSESISTEVSAAKQVAQTVACEIPDHLPPYMLVNDYSILLKAGLAVGIYFMIGTLCFYFAEDDLFGIKTQTFIDSLYFCVVTLTTVGYGDLVPGTSLGKLFTSFYIFIGFGLVGAIVSGAANYIVEMQERVLVHSIKRKHIKDYEVAEEEHCENAIWKVTVSGLLVLALYVSRIMFLILGEGMTFVDSFYCVSVTMTTLGDGDNGFKTTFGRLFAALWILIGTIFVGQFFLYLAEMQTVQRQLQLAHWVLHRKTTQTDLKAADIDGDGIVTCTEFVVYKLKELGKVDDDDVAGIIEEFRQLDSDHSGAIRVDNLKFAQGE